MKVNQTMCKTIICWKLNYTSLIWQMSKVVRKPRKCTLESKPIHQKHKVKTYQTKRARRYTRQNNKDKCCKYTRRETQKHLTAWITQQRRYCCPGMVGCNRGVKWRIVFCVQLLVFNQCVIRLIFRCDVFYAIYSGYEKLTELSHHSIYTIMSERSICV